MRKAKLPMLICAAAILFGGMLPSTSSAAYGPSGLGSNLHRRFVIKQAVKNSRSGKPVRRSAILWLAAPRSGGMWSTRTRTRRW